jgi:hypothetical protein
MWRSYAENEQMEILIDVVLYLLAIGISMMLGNIFKNTDDSKSTEFVKSRTRNRNRRLFRTYYLFRD